MTNYKTGWQIQKDIVLKLTTPGTTTPDSFENNGVLYQVPTGKTFYATIVQVDGGASTGNMNIYEADTEDAVTILKYLATSNPNADLVNFHVNFTVASGKFITGDPSGNTRFLSCILIGYER